MTTIHTILVAQGAEYKAVCRGLSRVTGLRPTIQPIPVGIQPLTKYLQEWSKDENFRNIIQPRVLVMGLCGSLNKRYAIGDIVLYQNCNYQGNLQECDRTFTAQLHSLLQENVSLVKSVTSVRVICSAAEKQHLGKTLATDVVDMEGFAVLDFFKNIGVAVAMLRVVSDDCQHDIPDLSSAISSDGSLQPLPLAINLLRQPIAATRLIRGSLKGLKVLEEVTNLVFGK
ncbi:phosphorylase [Nostocaceae cyanobacterium CENA369]|uniref:Phosphorylase n=1 Tax=Dendronalium phyllosphericum CENA369 TaxID=1725256 RepID=A0A8J7I194_9NOST|nr:phosphorylase [Dendronalium phyllosphericum]MBH8574125.1 phosphorylase [Dendronalium phyllosphericum CENA369]